MKSGIRQIAPVAWVALAVLTGLITLSGILFPGWIGVLLLLPALAAWVILLVIYNCWLASWRVVLLTWLAFGILRAGTVGLGEVDGLFGSVAFTLVSVLGFYALLAGYAALIALIVRRDVSVAYLFLPFAIGAPVMLATVQSAGSLLNWFDALMAPSTVLRSLILEPLLLNLTCMWMLGFIAAVPHMFVTIVREVRVGRVKV